MSTLDNLREIEEAIGERTIHMKLGQDGSYILDEEKQQKYDDFREAFYEGLVEGCKAGDEY